MKLIRTISPGFDPCQPPIQWEGDVRGIIAARRAEEAVRTSRLRLRLVHRQPPSIESARAQDRVALEVAA